MATDIIQKVLAQRTTSVGGIYTDFVAATELSTIPSVGSSLVGTIKSALAASLFNNGVTAQPLTAPPAWVLSTVYQQGQAVTNGGNVYVAINNGGTSAASGGPSGIGSAVIVDNTVNWYYWGPTWTSSPLAPTCSNQTFANRYTGLFWANTGNTYGIGSTRISDSSNFLYYGCSYADGTGTNNSTLFDQKGLIMGVSFITDAPAFQIVLAQAIAPSLTIFVNGVPVTLGMTIYSNNQQFFQMVFSDRRPRQITMETQTNLIGSFYGVVINDTISKVSAPAPPISFTMSMVGTSYLDGSGQHPVTPSLSLGAQIARYLGCPNFWIDRIGSGSGYVAGGGASEPFGHALRVAALAAATPPNVVLISGGGVNDIGAAAITGASGGAAGAAALAIEQAAALAYYQTVRGLFPSAIMIVIGSEAGNTGPSAAILNMEQAVANAVAQFNDPYCLYIPQAGISANKSFISGTGTTAATNGSGNSDVLIGADGIHPVQLGVNELAYLSANAMRKVLSALN